MNRLADAPEYAASVKKMAQTIFCRKSFAAISVSLEEFYQTEKLFDAAHLKNDVTRSQFNGPSQLLFRSCETFPPRTSSIRAQPLTGLSRQDPKRTPRWQPRGYDTQSFRPLVQEEEVS